jgi:hypothetical protein
LCLNRIIGNIYLLPLTDFLYFNRFHGSLVWDSCYSENRIIVSERIFSLACYTCKKCMYPQIANISTLRYNYANSTRSASDKIYQLLVHGRWFSPSTLVSSTTKTGRHDIAEILLKVASNTINKSINQLVADMLLILGTWDDSHGSIHSVLLNCSTPPHVTVRGSPLYGEIVKLY